MCFCTIDCQYSTLNRLFGCVLLVWRNHLRKVNKSSDALFLQFSYCLMFLNIQTDLIILKTFDQQFTLTTKKSLHIIFKDDLVGDCLSNSAPHIKCACRWQPVSKQSMHDLAGGETCTVRLQISMMVPSSEYQQSVLVLICVCKNNLADWDPDANQPKILLIVFCTKTTGTFSKFY